MRQFGLIQYWARLTLKGLKSIELAPTFALVIRLAERLRKIHPNRVFCLFLDNLFLNVPVAQALLALNICCTGITGKMLKESLNG
jgi:hypothetical protein